MRRREFIAGAALAIAGRHPAAAQQPRQLPSIAIVYSVGSVAEMAGTDALGINMRAFENGLRERGWIDGRTIVIERRSSEGDQHKAASIMAEGSCTRSLTWSC